MKTLIKGFVSKCEICSLFDSKISWFLETSAMHTDNNSYQDQNLDKILVDTAVHCVNGTPFFPLRNSRILS